MSFDADVRRIMRSHIDCESKVLLIAVLHHGDDAGVCRVTMDKLAETTGLNRRTVLRRVAELANSGWLSRPERGVLAVGDGDCESPRKVTVSHHGDRESLSKVTVSHRDGVRESPAGDCGSLSAPAPPTPPYDVLSGLDMKTTSSHAPERAHTREETPPAPAPTRRKLSPVEDVIRGHPLADTLRPYVEACLAIVGTVPDVFTVESWHARGYSLARVRFGLGQARQVMGQNVPVGRVIVSAGNWMSRAERHEYAHLEPKPVETPPSEPPRREMTPEERAAAIAKLDALLDDMPRRDGPTREGCA